MPAWAVDIVGGGLAGCEAALQLGRRGFSVTLHEMRPDQPSPAHRSGLLAELVCSNSLKSTDPQTASGLLKAELDRLGCALLPLARQAAVPAGAALAVDAARLSALVEEEIAHCPGITLRRGVVADLPVRPDRRWLVCSGPLTHPDLAAALGRITGRPALHFFDAIAPTVTLESLDLGILYRAARYGKGEADYLNAPLDRDAYDRFVQALLAAERIEVKDFDRGALFEGCQPLEEIAAGGPRSLAFGPLRPVGLEDPRTGRRPHAVVQLRQENLAGTLYGLVGFQTRLKHPEQRRVFRLIPGLEGAEFVRFGQMHRNFYLDSPRCLAPDQTLAGRPDVTVAGQITGVEGYVESIASGLLAALHLNAAAEGGALPPLPPATLTGALLQGFLADGTAARFAPMNANLGLLPAVPTAGPGKRARKEAKAARALAELERWCPAAGL